MGRIRKVDGRIISCISPMALDIKKIVDGYLKHEDMKFIEKDRYIQSKNSSQKRKDPITNKYTERKFRC